jgi:hypothetical protein
MVPADIVSRSLLAYEEVAELGEPAVFSAFGDLLVYVGGVVYELPRDADPTGIAQPHLIEGARRVSNLVGAEYGWRHLRDCGCQLCAPVEERHVA